MTSVGIDCDGVLRDFNEQVRKLAQERLGLEYEPTHWGHMFEIGDGERSLGHYVFNEWAEEIFSNAPPLHAAFQYYMRFINDDNIRTYIVTTQNKDHEKFTRTWLERNGFNKHHETLFLSDKTKAPCQVLIDDKYENVKSYIDKARMGILITQPWNKEHSVQKRADNLYEAYKELKKYI